MVPYLSFDATLLINSYLIESFTMYNMFYCIMEPFNMVVVEKIKLLFLNTLSKKLNYQAFYVHFIP